MIPPDPKGKDVRWNVWILDSIWDELATLAAEGVVYLLLMAAAAFIISWVFRAHLWLAGALPFMELYLGQSLLAARLTDSPSAQNVQPTEAS